MCSMVMDNRGFTGPIGDDLPSLLAILMALTLFFAGLSFSLETFNDKQREVQFLRGSIDASRALMRRGVFPANSEDLRNDDSYYGEAKKVANENGLDLYACYADSENCEECSEHSSNVYSYLIARFDNQNSNEIILGTLKVCTWRSEDE